jgi:hypothetical protein
MLREVAMSHNGAERRACKRFVVWGATVYYKKESFFFTRKYTDDCYPLLDISWGGCTFLSQKPLKAKIKVSLKIVPPGEEDAAIVIKGRVIWAPPNPGGSYEYRIAIQFDPYGTKKGNNAPESLDRLKALEQKFKNE